MDNSEKDFSRRVLRNGPVPLERFRELYKERFRFYPTSADLAQLLVTYDSGKHPIVTGFDESIDSCPERLIKRAKEINAELGIT